MRSLNVQTTLGFDELIAKYDGAPEDECLEKANKRVQHVHNSRSTLSYHPSLNTLATLFILDRHVYELELDDDDERVDKDEVDSALSVHASKAKIH